MAEVEIAIPLTSFMRELTFCLVNMSHGRQELNNLSSRIKPRQPLGSHLAFCLKRQDVTPMFELLGDLRGRAHIVSLGEARGCWTPLRNGGKECIPTKRPPRGRSSRA